MNVKPENLKRALAILTTEPDEDYIATMGDMICVAGQRLHFSREDDLEILSVLMADKEFGFATGNFEEVAKQMRDLQKVWNDAAAEMKKDAAA